MTVPRLADIARTIVADRDGALDLGPGSRGCASGATVFGNAGHSLARRSVLIATRTQRAAARAMVDLDGLVGRMTIAPPDLTHQDLASVLADAAVETIVTDDPAAYAGLTPSVVALGSSTATAGDARRDHDTQWVMLTSGTSGRAKIVAHTLAALTGAISPVRAVDPGAVWATFYDIRRYGGLQIFLRAILGGTGLVVGSEGEPIGDHLRRLGAAGVTAVSGTPSHWRRVLMSRERGAMAPATIRLSGEIADQIILDGLRTAYPRARVSHAYASTEAGVGFAVDDGLEGFPARLIDEPTASLAMKVIAGTLRIRSNRAATGYIGQAAASGGMTTLADDDGFIDTGDMVERRGGRCYFTGRRGGIINVGGLKVNPEEVEAVINAHAAVRMSLVKARRNPLTGAIVVADVVLSDGGCDEDATRTAIVEDCRHRLERHKVPVLVRFVPALALTPAGKISRTDG